MSRGRPYLVAGLLTIQASLLAIAAARHSPCGDEIAHLAAGIGDWQLDGFVLYKVNPPLTRMLAAVPSLLAGAKTNYDSYHAGPGARPEFAVMHDFERVNGRRVIGLVTFARCALIPLALLGGYVCHRWARELYGDSASVLALTLWCFCPNVLAYGQTITADAGAAALGVTASYLFWKWLREPTWDRAVAAAAGLGLAELTKTIWVLLFALWPVLWAVWQLTARRAGGTGEREEQPSGNSRRHALQLIGMLAFAVLCINMGYGFDGSGTRLRDFEFVSMPMTGARNHSPSVAPGNRFARDLLGAVPVPLPKSYVEGIDLQWHDIEVGKPSYLRGRWQNRGWWYWYLYALAVKVPLGTWGLLALAVVMRAASLRKTPGRRTPLGATRAPAGAILEREEVRRLQAGARPEERTTWRDELLVLAPAIVVLVLVSSQTGFSRYIRYVLPIFPFGFIWISSFARNIGWKAAVAAAALLAWSVGSSLWYAPHWMSYFNELVGGPLCGPRHLIDAQVDWGQDLLYLRKWLDSHPEVRPLGLVYYGPLDPHNAGIDFELPPKGTLVTDNWIERARAPDLLKAGWYAVSVNHLFGYPHYVHGADGARNAVERPYYSYFRSFRPVATAGYSIYIYHLSRQDIDSLHRAGTRVAPTTGGLLVQPPPEVSRGR